MSIGPATIGETPGSLVASNKAKEVNSILMPEKLSKEFLLELANKFGTPLYVYHAEKIKEQYNKLEKAFTNCEARFFYACKALTNINILKYIQQLGAGLDCVSIYEVKLGLKAGFKPENILYTPNCVDFNEIVEAKDLGVNLNIDNISILEQFGNKFGGSYPICIRLNPHIMAGGNFKISTGHVDSKFGISIHQLRHIERIVKTFKMHVNTCNIQPGGFYNSFQVTHLVNRDSKHGINMPG